MSVVMVMHWPEVTQELYEEARARVAWEQDPPDGVISHVSWMSVEGFRVVDVWESAEQFDRFAQERLLPIVKGELGIPGEPRVEILPALAHFVPQTVSA